MEREEEMTGRRKLVEAKILALAELMKAVKRGASCEKIGRLRSLHLSAINNLHEFENMAKKEK